MSSGGGSAGAGATGPGRAVVVAAGELRRERGEQEGEQETALNHRHLPILSVLALARSLAGAHVARRRATLSAGDERELLGTEGTEARLAL